MKIILQHNNCKKLKYEFDSKWYLINNINRKWKLWSQEQYNEIGRKKLENISIDKLVEVFFGDYTRIK